MEFYIRLIPCAYMILMLSVSLHAQEMQQIRVVPFPNHAVGNHGMHVFHDSLRQRDMVLTDINHGTFLATLWYDGDQLVFDKVSPPHGINSYPNQGFVLYEDTDGDGRKNIYWYLRDWEVIFEYDPGTLEVLDTIHTIPAFVDYYDVVYADVDGDGTCMWYFVGYHGMDVFSSTFDSVEQKGDAYQGQDIVIGNFDQDEDLEFVIQDGSTVKVVNALSLNLENELTVEFNRGIGSLDLENDGVEELAVLVGSDGVHCIDVVTELVKHHFVASGNAWEMELDDLHSAPGVELIIHSVHNDQLICYNVESREVLWDVAIHEAGLYDMVSGDFYGTGEQQIMISDGSYSTADDQLAFIDAETGQYSYVHDHFYMPQLLGHGEILGQAGSQLILQHHIGHEDGKLTFLDYSDLSVKHRIDLDPVVRNHDDITPGAFRSPGLIHLAFGDIQNTLHVFDIKKDLIGHTISDAGVHMIFALDYDRDGLDEIVVSSSERSIKIFEAADDGSYIHLFESLPALFNQNLLSVKLIQADEDHLMELACITSRGAYVYDTESQTMLYDTTLMSSQGEFIDLVPVDCDMNDRQDIAILTGNHIVVLDSGSGAVIWQSIPHALSAPESLHAMRVGSDLVFIVVGEAVQMMPYGTPTISWTGSVFGTEYQGLMNSLMIDPDKDGLLNLISITPYALTEFEATEQGMHVEPLFITHSYPANQQDDFPTNGPVFLSFNDTLLTADRVAAALSVSSGLMGKLECQVTMGKPGRFRIIPLTGSWLSKDTVMIELASTLAGVTKGFLDGNYSGTGSGHQEDAFKLSFHVSGEADLVGPVVNVISQVRERLVQGVGIVYNFQANDETGFVSSVIYGVDSLALSNLLNVHSPVDLRFDESVEMFQVTIETRDLSVGEHSYHLAAIDDKGNEGPVMSLFFEVVEDDTTAFGLFGSNLYHTGVIKNVPGLPYQENFSIPVDCQFCKPRVPVIWNGVAVVAYNRFSSSVIYFIDLASQTVFDSIEAYSLSSLSVFDGQLYYAEEDASSKTTFRSLDLLTMTENWVVPSTVQHPDQNSPHAVGDRLIVEDGEFGGISCLNRWTGELIWFRKIQQTSLWSPIILDDTIHLVVDGMFVRITLDGEVLDNRRILFGFDPSFRPLANIYDSVNQHLLWWGSDGVYAIQRSTGEIKWSFETSLSGGNPVLYDNKVFAFGSNTVYVLDAESGAVMAFRDMPDPIQHSPVLIREHLFVPLNNSTLALDPISLQTIWVAHYSGEMAVSGEDLVIADRDTIAVLKSADQCYYFETYQAEICFGELFSIGPFIYSQAGNYMDTLGRFTGDCDTIFTLTLAVNPAIEIADSLILPDSGAGSGGIAVQLEGGTPPFGYSWSNGASAAILNNLVAGYYTLTVTDAADCSAVFQFDVPVQANVIGSGVSRNMFTIHPNPHTDKLTLRISDWARTSRRFVTCSIRDMHGREVYQHAFWLDEEISLYPHLVSGMYVISILGNNSQWQQILIRS